MKAGEQVIDPAAIAAAREVRQEQDLELHRARAICTAARAATRSSELVGNLNRTLLANSENDLPRAACIQAPA